VQKTPLQEFCLAIRENRETQVQQFLSSDIVDVAASLPETGDTPLHVAFMQEPLNTTILSLLLGKGASKTAQNLKGHTPVECIRYAWLTRSLVTIAYNRIENSAQQIADLLDQGAEVNGLPGEDVPLHGAISWGSVENVKVLLERGADSNARGRINYSCLHMVGQMGFHEERTVAIARMLLEAGASLDAKSENGNTPIDFMQGRTKEWQPVLDLYLTYQKK
jgi:ankyrin repeat protein